MQRKFYEDKLYPLQNKVLTIISECNVPFYLTGGTALSRFYLHHRYSDDLDFFINRDENFQKYVDIVINNFTNRFSTKVVVSAVDFFRVHVTDNEIDLKIEFINDVGFHYQDFKFHQGWKIDNELNILSNKITALPRNAPKDFADILFLSLRYSFNWIDIFDAAKEKDTWVNELNIAEILDEYEITILESVNWIENFDPKIYNTAFKTIAKDILNGGDNSLKRTEV